MGYRGDAEAQRFHTLGALAGIDGCAAIAISCITGNTGFIDTAAEIARHGRTGDSRSLVVHNDDDRPAAFLALALAESGYGNAAHLH